MGADDHIDLALLEAREGGALLFFLHEAGEHGHVDRETLEALLEVSRSAAPLGWSWGRGRPPCLPETAALKQARMAISVLP